MAKAAVIGCELFEHMLGFIRPGLAETEVAAELEYQARLKGAEGMSFETIVASGARSALPHGRATNARLPRKGFLTLDFGIILGGYCSDMTRTVFLGKPGAKERDVYQAVLEAQEAAVAAVGPSVSCGAVDERPAACWAGRDWRRRLHTPPVMGRTGDSRAATDWRRTNNQAARRHGCDH